MFSPTKPIHFMTVAPPSNRSLPPAHAGVQDLKGKVIEPGSHEKRSLLHCSLILSCFWRSQ